MNSDQDAKGMSRRLFLRTAVAAVGGATLAACGGGGSTSTGGAANPAGGAAGGQVALKWSTWGNPGELQRFQDFTKDFNTKHTDIQSELIPIPNDSYDAKMLTQVTGGNAPDVFYAGDAFIVKLIQNKTITELTPLLDGGDSQSKAGDFFDGLWGASKTSDGKIYGVPVDCNPMVLWYNKKLLQDAGVTDLPATLYEQGKWNWAAFKDMTDKLVAKGQRGYILGNWWAHHYSFVTSNGGKVYDNNQFVANEDPKTLEAYKFIFDNVQAKGFTYVGGLPKGQGEDAMFMSQGVGFIGAGRWLLPVFKKNAALQYDIVAWPTNTGKKIEPAGIPTAFAVLNSKTANQKQSFTFLTNFVSKDGQTFRLQGGGNAVPSIKGADAVVTEGNLPEHAKILTDAREVGYALWPVESSVAGLSKDIQDELDVLWLKGGDVKATLDKIAQKVNPKLKGG